MYAPGRVFGPTFNFVSDFPFDEACTVIEREMTTRLLMEDFYGFPIRSARIKITEDGIARYSVSIRHFAIAGISINGWLTSQGTQKTFVSGRSVVSGSIALIVST
jgi:hypothetical protein